MQTSKKQQTEQAKVQELLGGLKTLEVQILALWVRRVSVKEFNTFLREAMFYYLIENAVSMQQGEWEDYLYTLEMLTSLENLQQ